jgi:ABC-2 type transport system ATP-binding protein
MQADYVIEVKEVWKSFKTVQAVRGVDLNIPRGQFVAILGPNGAGKTTLVEMIEGIRKPDKGEIHIMGKTWKHHQDELHRLIGISLQETRFIDKLRVSETLKLFAGFYYCNMDRVHEIMELVGLEEKRKSYVVNLSGGQRQRLALGIALINDPSILLLDEPTTGLDPNARREIWEILRKLKEKSGTSMILTTHYLEEAENLCDYIVIMDSGKILKEGTLHQLLSDETGEKIISFSIEDALNPEIIRSGGFKCDIQSGGSTNSGFITVPNVETDLPAFFSFLQEKNIKLTNIECRRKTLDDLFISLTGRTIDEEAG